MKSTHTNDPTWDCSGETYIDPKDPNYKVSDYESVSDFLAEYTGDTSPTFMSGYGLSHNTYEDSFDTIISDFVTDTYREVLEGTEVRLLEAILENNEAVWDCDTAEFSIEYFVEPFMDMALISLSEIESAIKEHIGKLDFAEMYESGREKAEEIHKKQLESQKLKQEQGKIDMAEANKLWYILNEQYALKFGKAIKKIEMADYKSFCNLLDENNISVEERILLSYYKSENLSIKAALKLRTVK